jgi:hypothetical protein
LEGWELFLGRDLLDGSRCGNRTAIIATHVGRRLTMLPGPSRRRQDELPTIQAMYAACNVVIYPLSASKTPAVKGYNRIGANGSAMLARKFADATAAGFVAGRRNRLTVVDIYSHDNELVDECLARFGVTVRIRPRPPFR